MPKHGEPKGVTVGLMYVGMKRMSLLTRKNSEYDKDEIISCLFYRNLMKCPIQYYIYPKELILHGLIEVIRLSKKETITKLMFNLMNLNDNKSLYNKKTSVCY